LLHFLIFFVPRDKLFSQHLFSSFGLISEPALLLAIPFSANFQPLFASISLFLGYRSVLLLPTFVVLHMLASIASSHLLLKLST